jgi:tetratricopeptide (TPR) repeat protein
MTKQELLNNGFQHFAKREYEEAQESFEKAIKLDDTFEAAYSALSETLNRKGEVDNAIVIVKKWIDINPKDALAHTALSRLYVQKGMIQEAEDEMAISNQLNLDNSGM